MENHRIETDLLGEKRVPFHVYYGVQTQRALENFDISKQTVSHYPEFVKGLAKTKLAAARANYELGILPSPIFFAIEKAAEEIIDGALSGEFPIDLMQGGAGTSTNMNANEVIANRALELMGHQKGEYQHCSPNDHVNLSQSTNDAYPTAIKLALFEMNKPLAVSLKKTADALRVKAQEFSKVLKMGRTQLQDAVPMTLGQEFDAFAYTLEKEITVLNNAAQDFLEVNMGATAIGTGLCAVEGFSESCAKHLSTITGENVTKAVNLVEATSDTTGFVAYASVLKKISLKLIKICNDLRLLTSGPRTGLFEINLPPMQPGSSIMPGKVNPVIPEVVNQICYKVIGNELTITMASENAQLQLNVMEPVIAYSLFESIQILQNGLETFVDKCIVGITANEERCKASVLNSIGIVTALNPHIGYKNSTKIAKEALENNTSVYDLVLHYQLLSKEELDKILDPINMLGPGALAQ